MKRTLIVDDMKEVYDKLQQNFSNAIYSSNVADALKRIETGEYNLVITDYHIGEDSPAGGLDVARKASMKGIECILMSTENHEKEALKAGANKFLFKKDLIKND